MPFSNTFDFMPHGMCFAWQPGVLWLHVLSDALIAFAYLSIASTIVWFVSRRQDLPFRPIFWMFSLFIVSCGVTHALAVLVIWQPDYWTEGIVKGITAVLSIATAILLVPLLPRALALRSPRELEALNAELAAVVRDYEHEKYIAGSFQSASLSDIPQQIDGIDISATYRPGGGDLLIGGDWYDAFSLLDGRLVVSIGDVTGAGLAASIIMSKVRQAIRVAALIQVDPARILDAANRSLEIEFPNAIVTAFLGIIDLAEGSLVYANAGHPRPLIRHANGSIEELADSALPLGLRRRGEEQSRSWELRAGSLVVLYTDGLVESTRNYAAGEARLTDALAKLDPKSERDPARAIFDAILFDGVRDDVAILTLHLPPMTHWPGDEEWVFDSRDRVVASDVREMIGARLAQRGASGENVFDADMVFSELMGNVYRYAPGRVRVRIDWRGDTMVLHVSDDGPGFEFLPELPDDLLSERGRGLFIINALVEDFHIKPGPNGGSHARAVLRAPRRRPKRETAFALG